MPMKSDVDDCEIEVVKLNLKQAEYEDRIVRLVRALLEIDDSVIRADDTAVTKEAA